MSIRKGGLIAVLVPIVVVAIAMAVGFNAGRQRRGDSPGSGSLPTAKSAPSTATLTQVPLNIKKAIPTADHTPPTVATPARTATLLPTIDVPALLTEAAQTVTLLPSPIPDKTIEAALTAIRSQLAGTRPPFSAPKTPSTPLPQGTYLPRDTPTPRFPSKSPEPTGAPPIRAITPVLTPPDWGPTPPP